MTLSQIEIEAVLCAIMERQQKMAASAAEARRLGLDENFAYWTEQVLACETAYKKLCAGGR